MNKKKKTGKTFIALAIIFLGSGYLFSDVYKNQGYIVRLTHSGNDSVHYPCLSDDGQWMLYELATKNGEEIIKSLKIMHIDTGEEKELFQDKKTVAPDPYENVPLLIGTKPPMLSGNGRVAVFVLSLGQPENILDHYLAMVNTDGTGFKIISFPMDALQEKDWKALKFESSEWERISHFAVNSDGSRVACVMKGHLGPVRYGNAGAIVLVDTNTGEKKTILAPDFNGQQWEWTAHPSQPLLGGGWAFGISGSGDRILFGAQSSDDKLDYDLYLSDWEGSQIQKITDFHDRWFSLAELSVDGKKVVFYYTGTKKQGMGTYSVDSTGSSIRYLESPLSPTVEFYDLSGNGRYIVYKLIYDGVFLDCETGDGEILFDRDTQGYVSGVIPMDFPQFPAFWGPRIMSHNGARIIISGIPEGKQFPEFYLLSFETKQ
jgi:Tol biopolymer transport system component